MPKQSRLKPKRTWPKRCASTATLSRAWAWWATWSNWPRAFTPAARLARRCLWLGGWAEAGAAVVAVVAMVGGA